MRAICCSTLYCTPKKAFRALISIALGQTKIFERVGLYESKFALSEGVPFAVATSMARVALYQVLKSLEAQPGETILLSPVNIPEMLAVIEGLQLKPVFIDFEPQSLTIDLVQLRETAVRVKSRFLFVTHLYGHCPDMAELRAVCERHGLYWIQDCTQANQSRYQGKSLPQWADFSVYSTCEFKWIHTYGGALVLINDSKLAEMLRKVISKITHPRDPFQALRRWCLDTFAAFLLSSFMFGYFTFHFRKLIFKQDPLLDFNQTGLSFGPIKLFGSDYSEMQGKIPERMVYKVSDFEADIGLSELSQMSARVQYQNNIAKQYTQLLEGYAILPLKPRELECSFWRFPILFKTRALAEDFKNRMWKRGIIVEKSGLSVLSKNLKFASEVMDRLLLLPCHPGITSTESDRVVEAVSLFLSQKS